MNYENVLLILSVTAITFCVWGLTHAVLKVVKNDS